MLQSIAQDPPREPPANNKIAKYNHTARGRKLFHKLFCNITIIHFFKGSFLQGVASAWVFGKERKPVLAAGEGKDSAACICQDLQEKQENRS